MASYLTNLMTACWQRCQLINQSQKFSFDLTLWGCSNTCSNRKPSMCVDFFLFIASVLSKAAAYAYNESWMSSLPKIAALLINFSYTKWVFQFDDWGFGSTRPVWQVKLVKDKEHHFCSPLFLTQEPTQEFYLSWYLLDRQLLLWKWMSCH